MKRKSFSEKIEGIKWASGKLNLSLKPFVSAIGPVTYAVFWPIRMLVKWAKKNSFNFLVTFVIIQTLFIGGVVITHDENGFWIFIQNLHWILLLIVGNLLFFGLLVTILDLFGFVSWSENLGKTKKTGSEE